MTPDDVAKWFAIAAPRTQRRGSIPTPTDQSIMKLTTLVNQFVAATKEPNTAAALTLRNNHNTLKIAHEARQPRVKRFAAFIKKMQAFLPDLAAEIYDPLGTYTYDEQVQIKSTYDAIVATIPLINKTVRTNQTTWWHDAAAIITPYVSAAWKAAGWPKLSERSEGPVLRVVQQAVKAATGHEPTLKALINEMNKRLKVLKITTRTSV